MHEGAPHGHLAEPGDERAARFVGPEGMTKTEEDILHDVFCIRCRTREPKGERHEHAPMPSE